MRRMLAGILATLVCGLLATADTADAKSNYMPQFEAAYPAATGSRIDACTLCHTTVPSRNAYGTAWANANRSFTAINAADSDGDGFTNLVEINDLKFPGNAADHPTVADVAAPTVDTFDIPAASTSLTVDILAFTASDDIGVTGYLLTQTATTPAPGAAAGWTTTAPTTYTFTTIGTKTLYAWAKDASGKISTSRSDTVVITDPPPPTDGTPPTVDAFDLPAESTSLTVDILVLSASDNVGVAGYLLKQTSTAPGPGDLGWSVAAPTSYTFPAFGTQTLYAWVKDAAGNVSASRSDTVVITDTTPPVDATPPTVDTFDLPAESTSLTVDILALSASDNVGVAGYLLKQTSTAPGPGDLGWSVAAPTSYTFPAFGTQTLYAWVKDAAGNVSASRSDTVVITDTTPPPPSPRRLLLSHFNATPLAGDPDWDRVVGRFGGVQQTFVKLGTGRSVALADNALAGLAPFLGGRIETKVRFINPKLQTRAEVLFDYVNGRNYRFVRLDRATGRLAIGQIGTVGGEGARTASVRLPRLFGRLAAWHHLRIDIDPVGGSVKIYVDKAARPALARKFTETGIGRVGVAATGAGRTVAFDNYVVWDTTVLP